MRLEKLLLRAFGPFTDRTLDFGAAAPAGLHLVYGPNEAGKSSSLRATVALLYGIALRSEDNFVHEHPDMRVGAVIHADDGQRLAVMRRKATKHPLRLLDEATGRDDEPAGADVVAALTGGMDRELFESMFGIDHARLRDGGRQLLAGEGELGASLFQAGSGLANVRGVLDRLDAEARERFVPRGTNPSINDTLKRLETLRREQRERTTRPREWAELAEAVEHARRHDEALAARMQSLRAEQRALTRLQATLPQAARHAQLAAELAALAGVPDLPADATEQRLRIESELARARAGAEEAAREADALAARHDAIRVDAALLAQAEAIARLHHDAERASQIERDRAVRGAEADRLAGQIAALLDRIEGGTVGKAHDAPGGQAGGASGGETAELARRVESVRLRAPSEGAVADLRDAAARLAAARQGVEAAARRVEAARHAGLEARSALDATPPAREPAALVAAHSAAVGLGAIERDIASARARLAQADARIADGARGLGAVDAQALRAAVPPPVGHAEALASRLAACRAEQARLRDEASRLSTEIGALRTEQAQLAATGEIVSAETLADARRRRDGLWRALQAAPAGIGTHEWTEGGARSGNAGGTGDRNVPNGPVGADEASRTGPTAATARAFERTMNEADRQADLLRADADRVARLATIERGLHERTARVEANATRAALLDAEEGTLTERWAARLDEAGLPYMEPDAFVRWHAQRDGWIEQCAARDEAEAALAARCALRDAAAAALARALAAGDEAIDLDALGGQDAPLAMLIEAATGRLSALRRQAQELLDAMRTAREADDARVRAQAEHEVATRQLDTAAKDWEAAIAPLRLPAGATATHAEARLRELDEVERMHAQWIQARRACETDDAWLAARSHDVEALSRTLGRPTTPGLSQTAAYLATLHAEAQAAQEAQQHAQALAERIDALRVRGAREAAAVGQAERTLGRLQAAAGCADPADLPGVEQRATRRRQLAEELRALEASLIQSADRPLQALLDEAAGRDPDEIARRLDEVTDEIDRAEPEARAAQQTLVDARHRLAMIDGSDAAAAAREAVEASLARLRSDTQAYARARLAHALLDSALAAYQERAQGPMIERATRLFSSITGGRYLRLRAVDDGDRRVLVAERDDGAARRIEQLSEGTRDVLYLALRLAALDLHLDGNPSMPLVLDDILLTFDDARAAATLAALAELSRRTQVLLFTHHEHLLEVAARAVQARDLAVHRLG